MRPLTISPKAEKDTDAFFHYIAKNNPESAFNFLEKTKETYKIISKFPLIASSFQTTNPKLSQVWWIPIKSFPSHLIFYAVKETGVIVIRVFHKAQDIMKILT